jgi:hypothetical protein
MIIHPFSAQAETRPCVAQTLRPVFRASLLIIVLFSAAIADGENVDIGNPTPAGSTAQAGDGWTIVGGGADIWGTSDQFHFSHQTISGSGAVSAKVECVGDSDPWAKGGVMIRADTAVGSPHASVFATHGMGVSFLWRTAVGGPSVSAKVPAVVLPVWVKLERHENDFTGFYSEDGKKWTQIGTTQTVMMKKGALAGLAVSSHSKGTACTAKFRSFYIKR